jgi:hypothetical protein
MEDQDRQMLRQDLQDEQDVMAIQKQLQIRDPSFLMPSC